MNNLELKEYSIDLFQWLFLAWSLLDWSKHISIFEAFPENIVWLENDSFYLNKLRIWIIRDIKEANLPKKIEENWLVLHKLENINLKNFDKAIEILSWEPFIWDKNIFKYNKKNIDKNDFIESLREEFDLIIDKMYFELKKQKSEN